MLYSTLKDSDSQHRLCTGLSFIANIQSLSFLSTATRELWGEESSALREGVGE